MVFLFISCAIVLLIVSKRFEPEAKKWLTATIQKRYQSEVEIGTFHGTLSPFPTVTVEDVIVRFHGRTDVPPMAKIKRMTLEATYWGIRQKPLRISRLTLEGLDISVPPRSQKPKEPSSEPDRESRNLQATFILQEVIADGMVLHLIPRDPRKDPRDFEFEKLRLTSAAVDRPLEFKAKLGNWKPPGKIDTTGHFGPWDAGDPGGTPVDGKYIFRDAVLSVFKGISGVLSSEGEYKGRLERIECDGTTDTPDFRISVGKPVDLKTEFHAIVDGTNGDTTLEPVVAHFLHSTLRAQGSVIGLPQHKGKDISLTVDVDRSRVEDILHLLVNSQQPLMVGGIAFRASFQLLPGPKDVIDRLNLKGHLNIPSARFTNLKIQDMLGNLSRRAGGDPNAEIDDHVASAFSSDFVLKNAQADFSRLFFDVPGAEIRLSGTYGIHGGEMDFTGQARTEARLSQMTTGVKSKLLKFVDPFFAKDGAGAVIPIKITGTREKPKFGLNFHKGKL
jgi:hypothetical protein